MVWNWPLLSNVPVKSGDSPDLGSPFSNWVESYTSYFIWSLLECGELTLIVTVPAFTPATLVKSILSAADVTV